MKTIRFMKKVIALNLLPSLLFIAIFSVFAILASCEKEKLADECDNCKSDSDCKSGMTCETFKYPSGVTTERCAKTTTKSFY